MATWDSPDLLQRVRDEIGRPDVDAVFPDAKVYRWLTAAESHWKPIIAVHAPDDLWSAPAILTAASDEKTFTFPSSEVDPLQFMLLTSATGRPLKAGPYWDNQSDYVVEKGIIRITAGRSMSFPDGAPYIRMITGPADIDANTDSTIFPKRLRILLVYHACAAMARTGMGLGDPSYYQDAMDEAAFGNPLTGDVGMIGALKARDQLGGLSGIAGDGTYKWWQPV